MRPRQHVGYFKHVRQVLLRAIGQGPGDHGPMALQELTTYKWLVGELIEGEEPRYFTGE